MFYAQLNDDNICVSVSQVNNKVETENMIEIRDYNTSLLGKKYNNGVWEDIKDNNTEIPLSDAELIQAELLLSQQEILTALLLLQQKQGGVL